MQWLLEAIQIGLAGTLLVAGIGKWLQADDFAAALRFKSHSKGCSGHLLLVAAELVSGPKAGTLAGAALGFTRGLAAVILARSRESSPEIADMLPRVRAIAARGNPTVVALGGMGLLGVTGH